MGTGPDKRTRLINFKVSSDEYSRIEALAERFAAGNVSLWLRNRGMTCSEVADVPADEPASDQGEPADDDDDD